MSSECCVVSSMPDYQPARLVGFDGVMMHRPSDIEESFAEKHSSILSKRRGRGLWLWKPYIINK